MFRTKDDYPKTKLELVEWIQDCQAAGYDVPCVVNGGWFTWIDFDCDMSELANDDEYGNELEYLQPGEEDKEFRQSMSDLSDEKYNEITFVRLPHLTGYNQENFDYQFGLYEY